MKRFFKWTAIVVVAVVGCALVVIYGVSEYRLRETFVIAATPLAIPADSASLANGRHIFETRGCTGCHGDGTTGKVFFDEPWLARLVAPNVPKAIKSYSDPELARLLRHGIRPNGRGVAVMPSSMFYNLDDHDLASLMAYLRTLPEREGEPLPSNTMRLLARVGLVLGQYKVEPRNVVHDAPRPTHGTEGVELGRYVAQSTCTECHGPTLAGDPGTPSLTIVAGYSADEFAKLLREGVPKDGRKMEMMTPVAISRFSHLTASEVNGLYAYLSRELIAEKH